MDVSDLIKFYSSPLGLIVQTKLIRLIEDFWGAKQCDTLAYHGFPFPLMDQSILKANRTIVLMHPQIGAMNWLRSGKNMTCLADDEALPLKDASLDRVILLHSLEHSHNPQAFLKEIWRALTPEGRIIVITPNRRSLWSHLDHTPFGHGNPYSMGQLCQILKESQFEICEKKRSLRTFPSSFWNSPIPLLISSTLNHLFAEKISGVVAVEAKKRVYWGTPAKERKRVLIAPAPIRARLSSRDNLG